jgi:hypothetical protein
MAEIEIEVDTAKIKKSNGGDTPDPTDPHFVAGDVDYGWAHLPAGYDIFGPEEHPFSSIGAKLGSYIKNETNTTITDFHIRVKNGNTIKKNPKAGGSLFPTVTYDGDGAGVTFAGGSGIPSGAWFWMKIPKGTTSDYEGHATPDKRKPGSGTCLALALMTLGLVSLTAMAARRRSKRRR